MNIDVAVVLVTLALLVSGCVRDTTTAGATVHGSSGAGATSASAAQSEGAALYEAHCAMCHDQPFYKAPSRLFIRTLGPRNILRVLDEGSMMAQSAGIDAAGRAAIAEYLSGKALADVADPPLPPRCDAGHAFDPAQIPVSRGWGVDLRNTRFQPAASGGITAANVAHLDIAWSFAYPNAYQARSQPAFGGGAIYVGSQDGTVWALDAATGCLRWRFAATAEVRTGIVITAWRADDAEADPTLFFGDVLANVYAVRAVSGELRWKIKADDHSYATLTGTPAYADERLYVPISSLEVVAASNPEYECCSFRGSLLAVDARSGEQIWRAYTVDKPPQPAGTTSAGTRIFAPSGAPIWSAPTIDEKRSQIYVATGENYSSPADGNSDAIIALDLQSGKRLWVSQQTQKDAWNTACFRGFPGIDNANCPVEDGPDHDFGSHTILVTLPDGNDVVVGGQKSGEVMGVEPGTGRTLWKTRVGRGGLQGGVHFGIAAEGATVYVPINDIAFGSDADSDPTMPAKPGVYAVDASNGELIWSAPAPNVCGDIPRCSPGVSQAITAVPGAVIAGHLDGRLRAYRREDGRLLWEKNLLGGHVTVSGETATGGAFSGGGVLIAHGRMYVNAGYGYNGHIPGNALVVLGLAEPTR